MGSPNEKTILWTHYCNKSYYFWKALPWTWKTKTFLLDRLLLSACLLNNLSAASVLLNRLLSPVTKRWFLQAPACSDVYQPILVLLHQAGTNWDTMTLLWSFLNAVCLVNKMVVHRTTEASNKASISNMFGHKNRATKRLLELKARYKLQLVNQQRCWHYQHLCSFRTSAEQKQVLFYTALSLSLSLTRIHVHTATVDLVDAFISVFMFFTALRQKVWPHFYREFLFL